MAYTLVRLGEVASTNDEAMRLARDGAGHGTAVVADAQTRGRGRQGHVWHSPAGENLYLSVILRTRKAPADVPPVTLAAGVATCDAVNAFVAGASLKWPNDVLLDGRKLAGILTETATRGGQVDAVVVGIGVNVNTGAFPAELRAIATSIAAARGEPVDREVVLARLLAELEAWLDRFERAPLTEIAAAWRVRAGFLGRRVRVAAAEGMIEGVAEDLDDSGALLVRRADGTLAHVLAGEILT